MRKELVNYLNEVMERAAVSIKDNITPAFSNDLKAVIKELNFIDGNYPGNQYRNKLFEEYYFFRYGYAYAFEYALLYENVLKSYQAREDSIFGVCSLGCGSLIDAWSLAYAKAKLEEEGNQNIANLSLRYYGVDIRKWPIILGEEPQSCLRDCYPENNPRYPECPDNSNQEMDLVDFFKQNEWFSSYNTIMFPKILNELDDGALDKLILGVEDASKRNQFNKRDELYICVSHSKSNIKNKVDRQVNAAQRIVNAINRNNEFEIEYDLPEQWNCVAEKSHQLKRLDGTYCYEFVTNDNNEYEYIEKINSDFTRIKSFQDIGKQLRNYARQESELKDTDYRNPVTTTSQIVFEIIKLTRKK